MKNPKELECYWELEREMANGTVHQCACEVCGMEEMPIVAADGLLFRCCVKGSSYIPTEMIDHNDLIETLRKQINNNAVRRRAASAPNTPSKKDIGKKAHFDFNDNISSSRSFSDSHPISRWRERLSSHGSIHRSPSTPSFKTMPKSIILKCSDRKPSDETLAEPFEEFHEQNKSNLRKRFTDQLAWVKENGDDFVAMESLKSTIEASALLCALAESKTTTVMQMKVNCNDTITVSYHLLDKFKQDFMMLKVSNDYCMFMAPF